jgi:hypothetical protein
MQPKYRADIKGEVATFKAECEATMRNELASAEDFILCAEDCGAWDEYKDYLTPAEMAQAFKRAARN